MPVQNKISNISFSYSLDNMYMIIQKNIVNYVNMVSPLGNRKCLFLTHLSRKLKRAFLINILLWLSVSLKLLSSCRHKLFTNSSSLELCPKHQIILDMYFGPGSILTKLSTSLGNRFARLFKWKVIFNGR